MPQFDYYSHNGITLMVEFKCMRKGCGVTYLAPAEQHVHNDEGSRYLNHMRLPKGWSNHWCGWLLCSACTAKIQSFLTETETQQCE